MNRRFLFVAGLFSLPVAFASAQITVEITEVPYQAPYAFLGAYFETGGVQNVIRMSDNSELKVPQTGFGLRMHGAKPTNVQFEFEFGYRKIDLSSLNAQSIGLGSLHLGGRLFPIYPQFGLGRSIAVRVTGSILGGYAFDFADSTVRAGDSGTVGGFDVRASAGLAFTGRTDPSGLTAEVVYRPMQLTGERFSVKPSWALRFGFLFGP